MIKKTPKHSEEQPVLGTTIVRSGAGGNPRIKMLIATPTLGIVRMEWAVMRYGQVIPCNWSSHDVNIGIGCMVPMHYLVADAQNIATEHCLQNGFEWLLLWEDDVIAPPDLFTQLDPYITKSDIPIVSGLYFLKAARSEPLCYRGRGTRYFGDFKLGDKFGVDGVPTGMLLVHRSILQLMWDESEPYQTLGGKVVKKVFETPSKMMADPLTGNWNRMQGTSDLAWCRRIIQEDVLKRAGWPQVAKREYPFLVDSNILCPHIDLSTGRQYPSEEVLKHYRR
jgi:hypothetical protein